MEEIFPEINFTIPKDVVGRWASRYPHINQITLYPHKGGNSGDENKLFFLDICMDDDVFMTVNGSVLNGHFWLNLT